MDTDHIELTARAIVTKGDELTQILEMVQRAVPVFRQEATAELERAFVDTLRQRGLIFGCTIGPLTIESKRITVAMMVGHDGKVKP